MTTIAFRDGTMAADSSCVEGDTHVGGVRKVWRVGRCLIGLAGLITPSRKFLEWFKSGADDESTYPWGGEFDAMVATPDGKIKLYEQHSMEPIVFGKRDKYMAIGSGMDIALGCMYKGGAATEAIRAAIKHNTQTKGPVRAYKIRT